MKANQARPFSITRIALMAVVSLMLLFSAGATVVSAVFHNDIDNNVAKIQAGDLQVSAVYETLSGTKIDSDSASANYGRLISFSETKNQDLTDQEEDIFEISDAVPTMTQTATLTVSNDGKISFDCEIRVCDLVVDSTKAADVALSNQILIKITSGSSTKEFRLSASADADSVLKIENVAPGTETTFTVSAIFLDDVVVNSDSDLTNDIDNSEAVGGSVSFDITIIAYQTTEVVNP